MDFNYKWNYKEQYPKIDKLIGSIPMLSIIFKFVLKL